MHVGENDYLCKLFAKQIRKMNQDRFIHTLSNGMKVAFSNSSGSVTYAGVLVNAGSRDEPEHLAGLAHFVEHTVFKGTKKRSSWHVSNRMETVGGELNAYTFKEGTSIYSIAPAGYEDRSLELLADLVENASFPKAEIDREREVVIEEINSYLDAPSDSVYDQFEELIYSGSSLAHNILGTPETVRGISGEDCRRYVEKYYNPANMVAFISTPAPASRVVRLMEKYFGTLHREGIVPRREAPRMNEPFDIVRDNNGHQAHTIMGTRLFGRQDPRRFALFLLNNYLGGPGMNSRLNQELREKRGLVYTVDSSVGMLSDTGMLAIYFGSDRDTVDRCIRIVGRQLTALAVKKLSPRTFARMKEQYCGQLLVSSDNRESMAMALGKNLLFFDKLTDIRATAERVRDVTPEEFREVAGMLAPAGFSRLTLM